MTCHVAFHKPLAANELPETRLAAINKELEDIHSAYDVAFTHRLDENNRVGVMLLPWRNCIPVTFRVVLHAEEVSCAIYIHVDCAPDSANDTVRELNEYFHTVTTAATGGSIKDLLKCHQFLFEDIWTSFFKENEKLSPAHEFSSVLANPRKIADFRGLIIGTAASTNNDGAAPLDAANYAIANSLKALLCCKRNVEQEDFSACMLKRGRLVNAVTFGGSEETHRYVLYSHSIPPEEIGKLVATWHRLAILRLAAIVPLPLSLEKATQLLRKIENQIDDVLKMLSGDSPAQKIPDPAEEIRKSIQSIMRDFAEIAGMFGGDVRDRLEKSIGYRDTVHELIESMGISDIQDYKSYKLATRELIDNKIDRGKRLLENYDRVFDKCYEIRNLAGIEATARRNTEIKELQVRAELFLYFALVPYYLGNSFWETVHALANAFAIDESELRGVHTLIWLSVAAYGVLLTLGSLAYHKPNTPAGRFGRATRDTIERWFKLFLRPVVLLALGVILLYASLFALNYVLFKLFPG